MSVIGSAFAGNIGAAAMLVSGIESVLEIDPEATFTLFSMYPDEDRQACRYPQVEIVPATPLQLGITINVLALVYKILPPIRRVLRHRSRSISALAKSSMLIDQMGVSFTDGREYYLLYNTAALLPAFLVGTPVVKCAQAIGPFNNPINRLVSKLFLPRVAVTISRGRKSYEYSKSLGLENVLHGADSAFLLREGNATVRPVPIQNTKAPRTLGIVPSQVLKNRMDKKSPGTYETLMVQIIESLTLLGHSVKVFAHSARMKRSTQNNDLPLCRAIMSSFQENRRVSFLDTNRSISDLRREIAGCDVLLTGRFHAMVSALALSVPPVVMGWGHKYEEVLEMFELSGNALPHQQCTHDVLIAKIWDTVAQSSQQSEQIRQYLTSVTELATIQKIVFADYLNGAK